MLKAIGKIFIGRVFFIVFVLLHSCCKDKTNIPEERDCIAENPYWLTAAINTPIDTFLPYQNFTGYIYRNIEQSFGYDDICFNPNNSNQFCCIRHDGTNPNNPVVEVGTFDFCTGVYKALIVNGNFYTPQWSATDWVTFNRGNNIWKIKPSGDSLTQLTFGGQFSNHGVWNGSGTKMCYMSDYFPYGLIICDVNGKTVDSVSSLPPVGTYAVWKWFGDNRIALLSGHSTVSLDVYDMINRNWAHVTTFYGHPEGNFLTVCNAEFMDWLDENTIVVSDGGTMYRVDVPTGSIDTIARGGDNRWYMFPARRDKETICFYRLDSYQVGTDTIYATGKLHLIDKWGTKQQRIELPY